MELKVRREEGEEGERGRWRRRWQERGADAHVLEKPQVINGPLDGEDGSVVVDLPNLGAQLDFFRVN